MIAFIVSLTASEAAQEPEEVELKVLWSESEYLGPVPSDLVIAERRAESGGAIDVYNTWTSFQKPKIKSNLTITGHSYQICTDRYDSVWFASLIFNRGDSIDVDVNYVIKGPTPGNVTCSHDDVNVRGVWLLACEIESGCVGDGFYKATAKAKVTRGGSGSANETCRFDMLDCR